LTFHAGFWKKNQLMLAKTCQQLKRKDEAKDWIAKCLALPVKTSEDRSQRASWRWRQLAREWE
jgi:hypothetical protein